MSSTDRRRLGTAGLPLFQPTGRLTLVVWRLVTSLLEAELADIGIQLHRLHLLVQLQAVGDNAVVVEIPSPLPLQRLLVELAMAAGARNPLPMAMRVVVASTAAPVLASAAVVVLAATLASTVMVLDEDMTSSAAVP
mgnify:CR=1 FL=1